MRVAIVGAGQMGSIYGGAAHDNGHGVLFIDSNQDLVDRINADGLRIDRQNGHTEVYRVPATAAPASVEAVMDLVLIQVKGWATAAAAANVKPVVGPETIILTLQNGLGNEEVLRASFPKNPILIGMSVHTVITLNLGHYHHTGVRDTALGPTDSATLAHAEKVASVFDRDGFATHVYPEREIRTQQWAKFVLNCGSLSTMALTRLPTAVASEQTLVFEHMDNLTRETCLIAKAAGIELDPEERVAFHHELFRTAGGRASMLGDVLAKQRTEIDTINGAAVMYAEKYGVPAPLNRAMIALVKGLEKAIEIGEA